MSVTKTKARAHMRSFTQKFDHSFGVLTHLPSSDSGIDECAMSSQHSTEQQCVWNIMSIHPK